MIRGFRQLGSVILAVSVFVGGQMASADVVNGSFESGFSDWTSIGPNSALAVKDGVLPTDGALLAVLTNGGGSLPTAVQESVLSSYLGLAPGSLSGVFPGITEGAILLQTVSLGATQPGIRFDWNFLTREATPDPTFNDVGFVAIWDSAGSFVTASSLDTFASFPNSGTEFASHTGWLQQTIFLAPSASYHVVFGVFDRGDSSIDSALLIDAVTAIPEPGSALLMAMVFGFAVARCRQRSR